MDEGDLERAKELDGDLKGFKTRREFAEHQVACLRKKTRTELQFFLTLAKMIKSRVPSNNVCLVDLEDMQEWTCDGLYFNKKGALVLFHDR